MATRYNPVVAEETVALSTVSVSSAAGGSGQSITSAVPTESVLLKNFSAQRYAIEYQVGSGAWTRLESGNTVLLSQDLNVTTLKARLVQFSPSPIAVDVEMNPKASSDPTNIVISSTAPSSSDGRPDGTIYIQTA